MAEPDRPHLGKTREKAPIIPNTGHTTEERDAWSPASAWDRPLTGRGAEREGGFG